MKLFFIIFFIFIYLNNFISHCQVYPSGQIKDTNGLCLTSPNTLGKKIIFESCIDSQSKNKSQQWLVSIGDKNTPTFQSSLNIFLCADISNNTFITADSRSTNNSFLSFRYTEGKFIIKSLESLCLQSSNTSGSPFFKICTGEENQRFFIDLTSKPFLPVYNQNIIPLTSDSNTNYFLDSNGINGYSSVYRGWERQLPGLLFKFNSDCTLTLSDGKSIVWKNVEKAPSGCSPSAVLKMQADGNLCTYLHENNQNSNWCTMTNRLDGRYFNILPYGSYGKKWGLVIQSDRGVMVWARWGESIYPDAKYNLIPGSFIDERSTLNNKLPKYLQFITNGRDYLTLNQNTGLSYYIGNPFSDTNLVWSSQKKASYDMFQKYGFPLILSLKSDRAVVTTQYFVEPTIGEAHFVDVPLWEERFLEGCRYFHIPTLNQNDINEWGWVIQNNSLDILYGLPKKY